MNDLTDQELKDIAHAMNLAVRHINVFSDTASRFIALEHKAMTEIARRRRMVG